MSCTEALIEELVESAHSSGVRTGEGVVAAAAGVGDIRGAGDAAVDDGELTVGCAGSMNEARVRWCNLGISRLTAGRSGMYGGGKFQRAVRRRCALLRDVGAGMLVASCRQGWVASCR